jgi:hypothetical protein
MGSVIGTKRQSLFIYRKDKPPIPDPFWYEKGAMKAIRNAKSRTIPLELESKIIALAKEAGKVRQVGEEDIPPQPERFTTHLTRRDTDESAVHQHHDHPVAKARVKTIMTRLSKIGIHHSEGARFYIAELLNIPKPDCLHKFLMSRANFQMTIDALIAKEATEDLYGEEGA